MFDVHVHIHPKSFDSQYNNVSLEQYILSASNLGIDHARVCINPFINGYTCPNNYKHKVFIASKNSHYGYSIKCSECGTVIYSGTDVFEQANLTLADECEKARHKLGFDVRPLAFLVAPYDRINLLVDKYEINGKFCGYKLHPTICRQYVSNLSPIITRRPILFHSGVGPYENPKDELDFSERHNGKVIIAHCCRFDEDSLNRIKEMSNVWIDTSPFAFLWNQYVNKPNKLYISERKYTSPKELFSYVIDRVGVEKIVFGSDVPFGSLEEEISLIKTIGLSESEIKMITYDNPKVIFNDCSVR